MKDFLTADHIVENRIKIGDIPALLFTPKDKKGLLDTIVFYHGWSSKAESQRLRAFILCSLGYQVIVPDAIHHGERGYFNYLNPNNVRDYFWPIIFNNMKESRLLINEVVNKYDANPNTLTVMGHSMGGFTAGGVFTQNSDIHKLVVFNGSCNWMHANKIFKDNIEFANSLEYDEIEKMIYKLDPMNNLESIINRHVLLLHGGSDSVVSIKSQRIFYEKIKLLYENKDKIVFKEYPNLDHYLVTDMMEDTVKWLKNI